MPAARAPQPRSLRLPGHVRVHVQRNDAEGSLFEEGWAQQQQERQQQQQQLGEDACVVLGRCLKMLQERDFLGLLQWVPDAAIDTALASHRKEG